MTVGICWCGGCNPRYDRRALLQKLIGQFPKHQFKTARPQWGYDVLLVVCGCSVACADQNGLRAVLGKLVLSKTDDWEKAALLLSKF